MENSYGNLLQAEDYDLWVITTQRPFTPAKIDDEGQEIGKTEEVIYVDDKMILEKNAEAKLILYHALSIEDINRISTYNIANEFWEILLMFYYETHSDMALMVLISIESKKVNSDNIVSMMAMSDAESDVENEEVNVLDLKNNLHILPRKRLVVMLFSLINHIEKLSGDKYQFFFFF